MPTVAILGASADRSKYGNKSVRAHQQMGYSVYPVNPKGGEIEGLKVYRNLAEVPAGRLNRISVYLPPAVGLQALERIARTCGGCGRSCEPSGTCFPVSQNATLTREPLWSANMHNLGNLNIHATPNIRAHNARSLGSLE